MQPNDTVELESIRETIPTQTEGNVTTDNKERSESVEHVRRRSSGCCTHCCRLYALQGKR